MSKAYTVAIGNFSFPLTKDQKKVVEMIKEMNGLLFVHPTQDQRGTLLFFKTLNDAKEARNILISEGVETGYNIVEVDYEMDGNNLVIEKGAIRA